MFMRLKKSKIVFFGHSLGAEFLFFEIKENPFSYYLGIWKGDILLGYIGTHVVDAYASIINFAIDTPYQKARFWQTNT